MNEMMSYIFVSLQKNEAALSKLAKIVSKQASNVNMLAVAGLVYIYVAEHRYKEQNKKIKKLQEELAALTSEKVEAEVNEP